MMINKLLVEKPSVAIHSNTKNRRYFFKWSTIISSKWQFVTSYLVFFFSENLIAWNALNWREKKTNISIQSKAQFKIPNKCIYSCIYSIYIRIWQGSHQLIGNNVCFKWPAMNFNWFILLISLYITDIHLTIKKK